MGQTDTALPALPPDMAEAEKESYIELLYSRLGIAPDEKKLRYYILLDELF